jgi:hypothetical protein
MFSRDVFIDVIELRLKIENKLKFNLENICAIEISKKGENKFKI